MQFHFQICRNIKIKLKIQTHVDVTVFWSCYLESFPRWLQKVQPKGSGPNGLTWHQATFAKLFTAPREGSSKISRWVIPRMISHCCSHYYFIWPATVNEILIDEVTIAIRIKVKKLVTFNTASHSRVPPFGCWIKPASHGLQRLLMEEIENAVYTNKCKHKKSLNTINYIVNKMYFN